MSVQRPLGLGLYNALERIKSCQLDAFGDHKVHVWCLRAAFGVHVGARAHASREAACVRDQNQEIAMASESIERSVPSIIDDQLS